jgi:hypothetical protein
MWGMKTKQEQIREFAEIKEITERITSHEREYIDRLLDEAGLLQPLMGSSMMYFAEDIKQEEAAAVVSLFLVVWGVYRRFDVCRHTIVSQEQFAREQDKTFSMFNFLAGENDTSLFDIIARDDFNNRRVPTLPGYIHHCFKTWPSLSNLTIQQNAIVNMSLKTFIDCFEEIIAQEELKKEKQA